MDIVTAVNLLNTVGVIAALTIAIWGGKNGWYIWKGVHEAIVRAIVDGHQEIIKQLQEERTELKEDRDYWRDNAVETLMAARRALKLADKDAE